MHCHNINSLVYYPLIVQWCCLTYPCYNNHIGGVIVSMLASSVVVRGFELRSVQIKYYTISMCCFYAKHAELRRKSKDWLWLGISFCLMLFNTTFNNILVISWRSVLLVEETGGPGENHQSVASHWQTLSHSVVHPDRDSNSQHQWW